MKGNDLRKLEKLINMKEDKWVIKGMEKKGEWVE